MPLYKSTSIPVLMDPSFPARKSGPIVFGSSTQMSLSASPRGFLSALAACLFFAGTASADTVVLRNGDRLTGTITHLSAHALSLNTSWGGDLKINRDQIASFETDDEVEWLPYWGAEPKRASFAQVASAGVVAIEDEQGVREVPMGRVAVINPAPEETADGIATEGRVMVSTAWSEGNNDNERIWAEADLSARARVWRAELRGAFRRERDQGETTADNWIVSGNIDRFFDADNFRYFRGSVERDRFKDLRLRGAVGGGLGLQLIETGRTQLSLRGGVDLVSEERSLDRDETYPAAGWGISFKHKTELLGTEVFHDQEGFWNLHEHSEMTVRSRSGIRMPIRGGVSASLQLNLDWEREPSPGRRSTDSSWLLGLGYQW
jgi:hypothetical protein